MVAAWVVAAEGCVDKLRRQTNRVNTTSKTERVTTTRYLYYSSKRALPSSDSMDSSNPNKSLVSREFM